jgi:GNAT superfamily N-acetyltransferase
MDWRRGPHLVSDDRSRLDLSVVHGALARSYWAEQIPLELVRRSLEHSLCFGLYCADDGRQIGFARVVTDRATFAYLSDVFVTEEHRGQGLGRFLVECVHAHPELQGLRRWLLVTRDAHTLYSKLGWRALADPAKHMEIVREHAYRQ